MTCAIPRPDASDLYSTVSTTFANDVLGGAPIAAESVEWFVVNNQFLGSEWFFSLAEQALRETRPEDMCLDNLIEYLARLGIYPLGAQFARGYVLFSGFTPGAAIPSTTTTTFADNSYAIDPLSTPPSAIGPDGSAIVMMQALVPGIAANASGAVGSLDNPLDGQQGTVTAYGAQFCAGADPEAPEAFRSRGLARIASVPNDDFDWLVRKAKEWPCLTRVCRRTLGCCNTGRIEAYVFFDGSFANGLAPQSVVDDVSRWLFGARVGAGDGQARMGLFGKLFTAAAYPVDITISGLENATTAQWAEIEAQFAALFMNRCPGEIVCRKWFEAIVTSIVPGSCAFVLRLSGSGSPGITCDGDVDPGTDNLPVLGIVTGGPATSCTSI